MLKNKMIAKALAAVLSIALFIGMIPVTAEDVDGISAAEGLGEYKSEDVYADDFEVAKTDKPADEIQPRLPDVSEEDEVSLFALTYGDYEYEVNGDDVSVTITAYKGAGGDVEIPDEIDGKSVTGIGYDAFFGNRNLKSVIIPNSVTNIGGSAFYSCASLTSVTISDSVTNIDDRAFWHCESLKSVTIPGSVASIDTYAFFGCSNLKSVIIPNSVSNIGDAAFYNCTSLSSAYFKGDSPTSFGTNVFDNTASDFAIYYPSAAAGFTTPEWNGYSALPYDLDPDIPEPIEGYTFKAHDLPEGYVVNPDKGIITGKCDTPGTYYSLIIAKKDDGSGNPMLIEITITVS